MRARVPQGVDLEDKLIFGLSPIRFGYLVIAVIGAFTVWGLQVLPGVVRAFCCLLMLLSGPVLAWGRVCGTRSDRLAWDCLVFLRRNHTLELAALEWRKAAVASRRLSEAASGTAELPLTTRPEGAHDTAPGSAQILQLPDVSEGSSVVDESSPGAASSILPGFGRELDLAAINRLAILEVAA
ncbi:MAG: hypothetical protein JF888_09035 [Candidatus Dormibacteraeota bacterium]|uniref:PrgI family protein n=1 Tax=Candidatus Dormiibacter inghamiae TaxID=3127013 RepID=A0A934KD85_9BACT|nr:hypothetical protein [Candidatus Dormibacteraeota bacterium]MBJ7606516.1 hypothetical protein [Candidatus Dormibacteraeota bacterium]